MAPTRYCLLPLTLLLNTLTSVAQLSLSLTTDKSTYAYGDSMTVRLTVANHTDSVISKWGSSTCFARIGFNSVHFLVNCTADYSEFRFAPGSWKAWVWTLEPLAFGIPDRNGEQIVYGYCAGMTDSITIQAPKFYGGEIHVGIMDTIPLEDIASLRDSLNVTVLYSY